MWNDKICKRMDPKGIVDVICSAMNTTMKFMRHQPLDLSHFSLCGKRRTVLHKLSCTVCVSLLAVMGTLDTWDDILYTGLQCIHSALADYDILRWKDKSLEDIGVSGFGLMKICLTPPLNLTLEVVVSWGPHIGFQSPGYVCSRWREVCCLSPPYFFLSLRGKLF